MTDYTGFRIAELHAITAVDPEDDQEGVQGMMTHTGPDKVRLDQLVSLAQKISDATGRKFKITRFSVREDIGEIVPNGTQV
jgi:hypothetical protein